MGKNTAKETMESLNGDMSMTSMIDVTFLLLIFFLCGQKFKVLENKLDTYLPKDTGPAPTKSPDERLPTEVKLRSVGAGNRECAIRLGTVVVANFEELEQRLKARHDTTDKKKTLPCDIYGNDTVHWKFVVQAFDAAVGAGIEKVQFGVGKENTDIKVEKR